MFCGMPAWLLSSTWLLLAVREIYMLLKTGSVPQTIESVAGERVSAEPTVTVPYAAVVIDPTATWLLTVVCRLSAYFWPTGRSISAVWMEMSWFAGI